MVDLVIHRHRLASILPHLIPHLEHVVLQLLLVLKLHKKPLLLRFRRICTKLKGLFHWTIAYRFLTAYHSRSARRLPLQAGDKSSPSDSIILTFLTLFVKKKRGIFSSPI